MQQKPMDEVCGRTEVLVSKAPESRDGEERAGDERKQEEMPGTRVVYREPGRNLDRALEGNPSLSTRAQVLFT